MDFLYRQQDIINAEQVSGTRICIIGCGGIGSHTALALARMGAKNLTLIDDDTVSIYNVASQGFDMDEVGKFKADAVRQKIVKAVRYVPRIIKSRVVEASTLPEADIYILAVDNMQSRKVIYSKIPSGSLVINPAMGAEYMTIDCYKKGIDDSDFDSAWFSDEDGVQETCTAKATIYTTLTIGGYITKIVKDYVHSTPYVHNIVYDLGRNRPITMFDSESNDLLVQ